MQILVSQLGVRRRQAFSLVEIILCVGLVAMSVLALYSVLGQGTSIAKKVREDERATQVMVELMDGIRLYSWDQITDKDFWPKKFTLHYDPVGATNGAGGVFEYKCTMNVKKGPNDVDYEDTLKTVTLEIEWTFGGAKRSREFTTFVGKDGLQSYVF